MSAATGYFSLLLLQGLPCLVDHIRGPSAILNWGVANKLSDHDLKPGIGSCKTITWRTRMIPKLPATPLQSPSAFHHRMLRWPHCRLSTQLQFQVGGNPKRHVLLKTLEKREVSDTCWDEGIVAWGISSCKLRWIFSWDHGKNPLICQVSCTFLGVNMSFLWFFGGGGVWLDITKFDGLKQNRFNRIDNEI